MRLAIVIGAVVAWSWSPSVRWSHAGTAADDPSPAALQRACDAGVAESCGELALMLDDGEGVPSDKSRAATLYEPLCAGRDGPFLALYCERLARLYDTGAGVRQDKSKAARLYRRSCDVPWASACFSLGRMYESGDGVGQDRAAAADFYRKACGDQHRGHDEACRAVERLRAESPALSDAALVAQLRAAGARCAGKSPETRDEVFHQLADGLFGMVVDVGSSLVSGIVQRASAEVQSADGWSGCAGLPPSGLACPGGGFECIAARPMAFGYDAKAKALGVTVEALKDEDVFARTYALVRVTNRYDGEEIEYRFFVAKDQLRDLREGATIAARLAIVGLRAEAEPRVTFITGRLLQLRPR